MMEGFIIGMWITGIIIFDVLFLYFAIKES